MTTPLTSDGLQGALLRAGLAWVDARPATLSRYSTDASIYRVSPQVVAWPETSEDVAAALHVAYNEGVSVTMRGAGTSLAGNAIGPHIVLDTSRYLRSLGPLDQESGTIWADAGVVHASIGRRVRPHGWRFGPDPSTHTRCTVGGMIGNNACGTRALGYGRTSDAVLRLQGFTADGEPFDTADGPPSSVQSIVRRHEQAIRQECGTFTRHISGYPLHHLLDGTAEGFARSLVGSEGTLAVVTRAHLQLVRDPRHTLLVVLGYGDIVAAADDVLNVLGHQPVACEGMDARIVDAARGRMDVPPDLPPAGAWLFVELAGDNEAVLRDRATALLASAHSDDHAIVHDPVAAHALWKVREAGAGLAARRADGARAFAGWEDAAVPPQNLAAYLRDFDQLLDDSGVHGVPYGHFGEGCVHVRLTLDVDKLAGSATFEEFTRRAARLVAAHNGSPSGEHGDGRARSDVLGSIFSPEMLQVFRAVKDAYDPAGTLGLESIARPASRLANLRITAERDAIPAQRALRSDAGLLAHAAARCTGVAVCREDVSGGDMCPTFQATADEELSTRGRARVAQDALAGYLPGGLGGDHAHSALDSCLQCNACSTACPTGTDVAALASESLHQRYRTRPRPLRHYGMRWGTSLARLAVATGTGGAVNRVVSITGKAGLLPPMEPPQLAPRTARSLLKVSAAQVFSPLSSLATRRDSPAVCLALDAVTNLVAPWTAVDTVALLEAAGYTVFVPSVDLPEVTALITSGQLPQARRAIERTVDVLTPYVARGVQVLVLEPSSAAVLRSSAVDVVGGVDAAAARRVADGSISLAEALNTAPRPLNMGGESASRDVVVQIHCHHKSVWGDAAERTLLEHYSGQVTVLGGCCGMAGDFGARKRRRGLSEAVARTKLIPALEANRNALVIADGISCRTQIHSMTGRRAWPLAYALVGRTASPSSNVT